MCPVNDDDYQVGVIAYEVRPFVSQVWQSVKSDEGRGLRPWKHHAELTTFLLSL